MPIILTPGGKDPIHVDLIDWDEWRNGRIRREWRVQLRIGGLYGGEGQRSRYANLTSVHARRLALALMMEVHRIEKKRLVGRQQ